MDVICLYLFIVGLFLGSFYLVVATRMPKCESILFPRSHCVNCNHNLDWYELIPVFSYIFLKGKCKVCKKHVSYIYPMTEIITGLLFMISYLIFGFSYETLISIVVVSLVIITIISDCKYMIILDEVLIVSGILIFILFVLEAGWIFALRHLLSGLVLFLVMLSVKLIGDKAFKQESLGWGDIKLSFIAGMILGFKLGIIYIFLGAILALPYAIFTTIKKNSGIIPFGPFLVLSLLIIFWNSILFTDILNTLLGV